MNTLREAAQQALEALEGVAQWVEKRPDTHPWDAWQRVEPAITTLRAALEQPDGPCPTCVALARTVMMDQMGTA
jgi:hypothetical protein